MTITTRKAIKKDRDFLWRLKAASMRKYVEQIYGWDDALQEKFFDDGFCPEDINIIQFESRDVGMYELEYRGDDYFLSRIEIKPEFQNRGIGSAVIKMMIDKVGPTRKPLRLQVFKINPAQSVYTRLGFIKTGETENHYQMELVNKHIAAEADKRH
jgi:GNAT superfamily N-acetyltransferase